MSEILNFSSTRKEFETKTFHQIVVIIDCFLLRESKIWRGFKPCHQHIPSKIPLFCWTNLRHGSIIRSLIFAVVRNRQAVVKVWLLGMIFFSIAVDCSINCSCLYLYSALTGLWSIYVYEPSIGLNKFAIGVVTVTPTCVESTLPEQLKSYILCNQCSWFCQWQLLTHCRIPRYCMLSLRFYISGH